MDYGSKLWSEFMRRLLSKLAERTSIAIILRKIIELNFHAEKAVIRQYLPMEQHDKVLDIGCGTGEFAPLFPVEQYVGIDIDGKNIAYARSHYPHHFEIVDGKRMPFLENSFTIALVVGVFHHLSTPDCQQVLSEIKRVVKPGGRILIMEDTHSGRLIVKILQSVDQGAYIRDFSEWNRLLAGSFKIEKTGVFNSGASFYSYFLAHNYS